MPSENLEAINVFNTCSLILAFITRLANKALNNFGFLSLNIVEIRRIVCGISTGEPLEVVYFRSGLLVCWWDSSELVT